MSTAIQVLERQLSQQEMAERVRQYHECMEPHIKAVAHTLGMSIRVQYLMADGELARRIYSPQEQAVLDSLGEISRMYMHRLGLATPPGDG